MSVLNSTRNALMSDLVAGCLELFDADVFFTAILYQHTPKHASNQTRSDAMITASPQGCEVKYRRQLSVLHKSIGDRVPFFGKLKHEKFKIRENSEKDEVIAWHFMEMRGSDRFRKNEKAVFRRPRRPTSS